MTIPSTFIVGGGRVGTALAMALARAGASPVGIWTRGARRAREVERASGVGCAYGPFPEAMVDAEVLLLTVSDPVVPHVAGALMDGGLLREARAVMHCGGSRSAQDALAPLRSYVPIGTLHPLLAVQDPVRAAIRIPGVTFAVEGDPAARELGRRLALGLGGRPLDLRAEDMALYHAAAVLASNHTVALICAAHALLARLGVPSASIPAALLPLVESTVDNFATLGCPKALTGPVRRGDPATIQRHLDALAERAPELLDAYRGGTHASVRAAFDCGEEDIGPALQAIVRLLEP